jgi:hypothetical protein
MELMLFYVFDANGLEGSEADMERNFCSLDSSFAKAGEDFRGEMQSRGGGGDGAALLRVDRLIALAIGGGILAGDVGRQWDVTDLLDEGEEVVDRRKTYLALAKGAPSDHLGTELVVVAEEETFSDSNFAAGAHQALPLVGIAMKLVSQKDLDASAKEVARGGIVGAKGLGVEASPASEQARGEHAGVVEYDKITRTKEVGKFAELAIFKSPGLGRQKEQPGCGAVRERLLRDQFRREFVMKIGDEHAERL